jgi:hypothetical protein
MPSNSTALERDIPSQRPGGNVAESGWIFRAETQRAIYAHGDGATFEVGVPGLTADLEDPYQRLLEGPAFLDQQTMIVT